MHMRLAEDLLTCVRRRIREGDATTEPPLSVETLEQIVEEIARQRDAAKAELYRHMSDSATAPPERTR